MANEVIINIPGIGDVVAENAASEATLRDILSALGGRSGGGGNSGGSSGGGSGSSGGGEKKFGDTIKKVADNVDRFGASVVRSIDTFSRLNGSVTSAAGAVGDFANKIPLIGRTLEAAFDAVAGAQTNLIGSFQQATTTGAAFAGSLSLFTASATAASMTLDEYGKFVASHGEAMRALGETTAAGAKRFSVLSQALQGSNTELYNLGLTTADINNGLASYAKLMQMSNNVRKKSDADLITGTKAYLKELDLVAKATGLTREQAAGKMAEMNVDTQFSAFMDSLGAAGDEIRTSLLSGLTTIGAAGGSFLKDLISSGGIPTTDEHAEVAFAFGRTAAKTAEYNAMAESGRMNPEQSAAKFADILNTYKQEAAEASAKYGVGTTLNKYNAGLQSLQKMTQETRKLESDARAKAAHDQDADLVARENSIQKFIDLQKAITGVGNSFTLVLSQSGVFDVLIESFNLLSSGIEKFSIPLFKAFGTVIKSVSDQLAEWFRPFMKSLGDLSTYIPSILSNAFSPLGDFLKDKFSGILDQFKNPDGKGGFDTKKIASWIAEKLGTGINYLVAGFRLLLNAIVDVTARVQLYALSMDEMKINMLRFMVAMDTVASWLHISGAKEAKERHEGMLAWEEAVFNDTRKERKEKEDELHRTIAETTKKYKDITDDLDTLNNKVKENSQNVTPSATTTEEHAAETKAIASKSSAVVSNANLPKNENDRAKMVMQMLMNKGWTAEQAAGISANLHRESRFIPGAVDETGKFKGVGQWDKTRQEKFKSLTDISGGKSVLESSLAEQVEFVNWELNNTHKAAGDAIRNAKTAREAALITEKKYEVTSAALHGGYHSEQLKIAENFATMMVGGKPTASSALPIKDGASAGGKVEEGTMALVQAVKNKLGGLMNRVTALNDQYHQEVNPTGGHAKGLKADITITKKQQSAYAAEAVRQVMAEHGIKDYIVNDEYAHPSEKATAGHLDIGFKRKIDAEKFATNYKARQEEERAAKQRQEVDKEEQDTQRAQQEEMQKQNAQNVQSSTDTHSQLFEQLLTSMNELKQINMDQLSNQERHISIAQGQSGNVYVG